MVAPSFRDALLNTNGLIGYWRTETSGSVAKDECGKNYGTYIGTPTFGAAGMLAGDARQAVTFSSSAPIEITDTGIFDCFHNTGSWTIGTWIRRTAGVTSWIFEQDAGNAKVYINMSDGILGVSRMDSGSVSDDLQVDPLVAATNNFVVATYDGALMRLYTNAIEPGKLFGTTGASTRSVGSLTSALAFGGPQFFGGGAIALQDMFICNRPLAQGEIDRLYHRGRGF